MISNRLITAIPYLAKPPSPVPNCQVLKCKKVSDYQIKNGAEGGIEFRCAEHVNTLLEAEERESPGIVIASNRGKNDANRSKD